MQFSTIYGPQMLSNGKIESIGVYIGSHDPQANNKQFSLSLIDYEDLNVLNQMRLCMMLNIECMVELASLMKKTQVAQYSIFAVAPGANDGYNSYKPEWPIVIQVYRGDWYDASQIYRNWVLPNAEWTKQGPMKLRDDVPDWIYSITTWINSHW